MTVHAGMERVGAAADFVDGKVGRAELLKRGDDGGVCFVTGLAADADIERKRDGVVADVGRVVAGGAGSRDGGRAADAWHCR